MTPISLQQRREPVVQRAPTEAPPEPSQAPAGLPRFLDRQRHPMRVTDAGPAPTDAGGGLPGGVPAPPLPTGPDACSTVEEEERKTKFRARSFSALNFRPSAGYGQFDAYYWPASSLMAAIVKMKFNFVEADNTPPPATLRSMWMAGQDISSSSGRTRRRHSSPRSIATGWRPAGRSCTPSARRSPAGRSPPARYIAPRVVGDPADAHFDVTVRKGAREGRPFRPRIRERRAGGGPARLMKKITRRKRTSEARSVARSERQRLERAIAAATASPILFLKDSAVIQPAELTKLRNAGRGDEGQESLGPGDPDHHQRVREQRGRCSRETRSWRRTAPMPSPTHCSRPECRSRW